MMFEVAPVMTPPPPTLPIAYLPRCALSVSMPVHVHTPGAQTGLAQVHGCTCTDADPVSKKSFSNVQLKLQRNRAALKQLKF